MGIGTILIGAAMMVVVVALVLYPLFGDKQTTQQAFSKSDQLQRERQQIVLNIRELDHDYRTGKMTDTDYQMLRTKLVERGAQILRQLDALAEEPDDAVDLAIEQLVQHTREAQHRCPTCQRPIIPGAQYCAFCGVPLAESQNGR